MQASATYNRNESSFITGLVHYLSKHAYSVATTGEFLDDMEESSGMRALLLCQVFGRPQLTVEVATFESRAS